MPRQNPAQLLYTRNNLSGIQKGKFEYKADKTGIVHVNFGKSDFTQDQLVENLTALWINRTKSSVGVKVSTLKAYLFAQQWDHL
jgi:ribosomal protein L1